MNEYSFYFPKDTFNSGPPSFIEPSTLPLKQGIPSEQPTGEIKIKRQGKMAVAKVILKSSKSIKPFFSALGNKIAAGITYPFSRNVSRFFNQDGTCGL